MELASAGTLSEGLASAEYLEDFASAGIVWENFTPPGIVGTALHQLE